ncbi:WD40/YVTN repeat-like-containing domain-containing protein [Artemisia annua]|uniref:WD40/YVTN repeat-like-containing domain-containing protein n=1 Tax=Artemisia annua TaxID=35608 RepID=A0A2U1PZC1_ARTAN|nr:WD40/YVTN repeat-like-containing domain-containing protein [Artemisia annua]
MSTSRRTKPSGTGAVAVNNIASARPKPKPRSTTPVSERIDPFNTGKENTNYSAKLTSRPSRTKPFVPQIVKTETTAPPRARWSSSVPRGRSASPCEFGRANGGVNGDVRKTRVSRVSNERSVSVDRSARIRDRVGLSNTRVEKSEKNLVKKSEKVVENKANVNVRGERGEKGGEMRAKNVKDEKAVEKSEKSETGLDSVMKVSESVKMFERFKSKSSVGLRGSTGGESEESGVRLSFGGSSGRLSKGSSSSDGSSVKYPSKLHGKLAFLEEKVKRIASDIKRTKEMLDLNNPDASKVMLSDIQETVAGIEKAMGDVVSGEKEKKNVEISVAKKNSPIKESSEVKSLSKGLNNDELEARLFPHHKLLRDRTTLKAPLGSHESIKTKVAVTVIETKQDEKPLGDVVENCKAIVMSDSSSKLEPKVTVRSGLELCEVQETEESGANSRARDSLNSGKGNDVLMLAADETLEEFDDEENKPVMVFDVEFDDSGNDQLNEIGNKTCTGGWFMSEGESALLAHDDGSCSFYDVVNSEVKSVYKPPAGLSPNLWRDCWIVRALGADGCSARYVVAASAGNSMDSGFCSWDFYTREIKSFHIEDGVTNTRTALAPLSNNALNRRHDLSNLTPENRQWWYKPCGPLIVTTASNQKVVKVFDIRDGEHVMKWDVQSHVVAMDNSSPLQWRNRGKVVLAETENVSLWDVGSLIPEPLLTVSSSGKKITALHVNNTDAELGGGVRQRQETVAGIEKAMGDVVSGEKEKKNVEISVAKKNSPIKEIKESSDLKSLAKGLNNDELEARLFPHHKLLRDRTTLKAPLGSHESIKSKVAVTVIETKQDQKPLSDVVENCKAIVISDSSSKLESKVTVRGGLELCEVQETEESGANSRARDSFNSGKGNDVSMLAADETLEEFDDEENKPVMVFDVEFDDSGNDQLNEIGNKTCTGGWFMSEGESALLAHDDGSCSFYDVVNSEVKSVYKPPADLSSNLWRDCWIVRALGADGCSARYVVAASAGNSMDSGFCSWDFYTREIKSFHIEDGVTNTRTALAPLSNNALNRRHDLSNLTPENRQWWYKPCGPLIVTTASNQKVVKVFDIRDGEHVMKWDVQSHVVAMDNSSPLQWRNRGKVVLAETENVSLWDVGSLTPEPLLTVSSSGKKITALHVNNTDAELGGGVRQRVSSSEAEGNDGVFCTSDSINVLDFRHPSGIGLRIPKYGNTVHSVFSRGDSIYLGCSGSSSTTRKLTSSSQIQQFSLRRQKLFTAYMLPESNAHSHYKAITQVWGNSNLTMGVSGLGLFVFDALKDDGSRPLVSDYGSGQKVRETIGPDNLYSPTFDYLGSRALLISRDRPACWKYLS